MCIKRQSFRKAFLYRNYHLISSVFIVLEVVVGDKSFRLIITEKGHPKLVGYGYGFIFNTYRTRQPFWPCDLQRQKRCRAKIMTRDGTLFYNDEHNHPPNDSKFWFFFFIWMGRQECTLNNNTIYAGSYYYAFLNMSKKWKYLMPINVTTRKVEKNSAIYISSIMIKFKSFPFSRKLSRTKSNSYWSHKTHLNEWFYINSRLLGIYKVFKIHIFYNNYVENEKVFAINT